MIGGVSSWHLMCIAITITMSKYLFSIALIASGCASTTTSEDRVRLSAATGDCKPTQRVCLETHPPQCMDVCADAQTPDGDCAVSSDSDVVRCGNVDCIQGNARAGASPGSAPPLDACTQDAKICPDGQTAVGRVGPYCEFAPCPGETEPEPVDVPDGIEVVVCPAPPSVGTCGVQVGSDGREAIECYACPADAMLCPDGVTSVGRTGADCSFAPCPGLGG